MSGRLGVSTTTAVVAECLEIQVLVLNTKGQLLKRVLMGLTDRRYKTVKNLVDSRKNWKILTVSRK